MKENECHAFPSKVNPSFRFKCRHDRYQWSTFFALDNTTGQYLVRSMHLSDVHKQLFFIVKIAIRFEIRVVQIEQVLEPPYLIENHSQQAMCYYQLSEQQHQIVL
jgi:hypothetical protein